MELNIPFGNGLIFDKFKVESLEVVEDHVHVLVSATPQHTIPNIVKMLKGRRYAGGCKKRQYNKSR